MWLQGCYIADDETADVSVYIQCTSYKNAPVYIGIMLVKVCKV